jgi:hypothetical protein
MIGTVTFWLTYPYKPMEVNSIKVLTPEVGKGKPLTYQIDYCKYMDIQPNIQKAYENDIIFPASITSPKNELGCRVSKISQVVPYELPSARYKLKIVFVYKVNPIREISFCRVLRQH